MDEEEGFCRDWYEPVVGFSSELISSIRYRLVPEVEVFVFSASSLSISREPLQLIPLFLD